MTSLHSPDDIHLIRIIGTSDFEDVAYLYRNPEITKWIRDGRHWDDAKILRYLNHFLDEDHLETGFVDYKIVIFDKTVGIVGFRTDFTPPPRERFYKGRPFISILIDPLQQGKGYATKSLQQAIQKYNEIFPNQSDFYSYIKVSNLGSIRVHEKAGFNHTNTFDDHTLMTYSMTDQSFSALYGEGLSKETLIPIISGWIIDKLLEFPYSRLFIPTKSVMMDNYKSANVSLVNRRYDKFTSYHSPHKLFMPPTFNRSGTLDSGTDVYIQIISDHYPDYQRINGLTDQYIEDQRIRSRKKDKSFTTEECWNNRDCAERIVTHMVNSFPSYIYRNLRDSVFSVSRDPGLFKLMWVRGLLQILVPELISTSSTSRCRMLDISSGWGDRLLGAIAHGCDYLGYDPNIDLKLGHDQMIDDFGDITRHRVIYKPFEEANLSREDPFDICITSPPFFDIEIYSETSAQSIQKFPKFNEWMVGFLFESLSKVWDNLKFGGYLAIHMGDVGGHSINEPMLLFIEQYLKNSSYQGVIGVGGDGPTSPVWIWKKVGPDDEIRTWSSPISSSVNDRLLTKLHPEIAQLYLSRKELDPRGQELTLIKQMTLSPSFTTSLPEITAQYYNDLTTQLDPTVDLCRVKDTFTSKLSSVDPFAPTAKPEPFTLNELIPVVVDIKTHPIHEVNNLQPSSSIVNVDRYKQLLSIKDMFSRSDDRQFEIARNVTNPFENIGNSIFMNRASVKIANIDAIFNFTQRKGGLLAPQEVGPLDPSVPMSELLEIESSTPSGKNTNLDRKLGYNFCDIASAPGGFSEYIQYRFPVSYGWGMSLREGLEWNREKIDMERFNILWGNDDTGNLYTNADWFSAQVRSKNTGGVDLVMADGGFDVSSGDDFNRQEFLSTRLIINELLVSLSVLGQNGVFVCKVFDTVTTLMAEVLFIMASAYKEFNIFKPMSSRPGNSERYVICKYPRSDQVNRFTGILRQVNSLYNDEVNVTKIFADGTLTDDFVEYLRVQNNISIDLQIATGNNIIRYLSGQNIALPKYDLSRSLLYWNLPDNPVIRKAFRQYTSEPTESFTSLPSPDIITRSNTPESGILTPGRRPFSPPRIGSPSRSQQTQIQHQYVGILPGEAPIRFEDEAEGSVEQLPRQITLPGIGESFSSPLTISTVSPDAKTYVVRTDQYEPSQVAAIFEKRGWKKNPDGRIPTFVYEDGNYLMWNSKNPERGTYKGKTIVKTTMGESRKLVADKSNLYRTIDGKHMTKQYDIDPNPTQNVMDELAVKLFGPTSTPSLPLSIELPRTWIVRPVERWFFGGKGIFIVQSIDQLQEGIKPNTRYVVSEYIDNPLLWVMSDGVVNQQYKFHLRIYIPFGTDGQYILDPELIFIYPAELPYVKGDYSNKGIHDTHYIKNRIGSLSQLRAMYPQQYDNIYQQIQKIIMDTLTSFKPDTYPEVKYAVQLFGFDIMFDDRFNGYLLEVNDGVGLREVPMELLISHTIDSAERLLKSEHKTYRVRSEWFGKGPNQASYEHVFTSRGWHPATKNEDKIGLVYEDSKFAYKNPTYKGKNSVKSRLNDSKEAIVDKNKLYHTLKGSHMLQQYFLASGDNPNRYADLFNEYRVWIVKPVGVGFYSGKGISVVTSFEQLTRAINPEYNYVIARYLTNPLLYKTDSLTIEYENKPLNIPAGEKKFHIRVLVIVATDKKYIILNELNEIYPAILPYQNSQYDNKSIHDTHFVSHGYTGGNNDLVERFGQENTDMINGQINTIIKDTVESFNPGTYNESDHGFEIFGYDFIVDQEFLVHLIEVNRKVGLEGYDPSILFGAVLDTTERLMK
jgi:RimJ/RimL family protein N-acetyltransferase